MQDLVGEDLRDCFRGVWVSEREEFMGRVRCVVWVCGWGCGWC